MHGALAVKRYLERASSGSSAPVSPRVGTPRTRACGQGGRSAGTCMTLS